MHMHMQVQVCVTNALNKKVRYASPRIQNPGMVDAELETLFTYVESVYMLKNVHDDIKQWDEKGLNYSRESSPEDWFDRQQSLHVRFQCNWHIFFNVRGKNIPEIFNASPSLLAY